MSVLIIILCVQPCLRWSLEFPDLNSGQRSKLQFTRHQRDLLQLHCNDDHLIAFMTKNYNNKLNILRI